MRYDLTFFGSNKRLRRLSLTFQDQNTWFQKAARRLKSSVLVFLDKFLTKTTRFLTECLVPELWHNVVCVFNQRLKSWNVFAYKGYMKLAKGIFNMLSLANILA